MFHSRTETICFRLRSNVFSRAFPGGSMELFFSPFTVAIVAIVGGIMAGIVSTISKGRVREMEIRERIAMIERGLVPPPEADPAGFERSLRSVEGMQRRHHSGRGH